MPITNDFKTLEADYIRYLLNYFDHDKEALSISRHQQDDLMA